MSTSQGGESSALADGAGCRKEDTDRDEDQDSDSCTIWQEIPCQNSERDNSQQFNEPQDTPSNCHSNSDADRGHLETRKDQHSPNRCRWSPEGEPYREFPAAVVDIGRRHSSKTHEGQNKGNDRKKREAPSEPGGEYHSLIDS